MFEDLRNTIDFFIRNKTKFSRKNFVENDIKLLERNQKENLYTQDILDQYFEKISKPNIRILDIGSKNWFYVKGEYQFFQAFVDGFQLDGIEIDAYRLYSNFFSRYEVAKFYTKGLENTNYIAGNLLDLENKYDYIVWFLPFVTKDPLVAWGLPLKHFCPQKLLEHAYNLLENNGQMLIVNQGEKEANIQKQLLEELNIPFEYRGAVQSPFFQYQNKRYAFLVKKPA